MGAEPPVPRGSRLTRSNRFSTDSGTHEKKERRVLQTRVTWATGVEDQRADPIRLLFVPRPNDLQRDLFALAMGIVERNRELSATPVDLGCKIGRELGKLRIESGRAIAERYRGAVALGRRSRPGRWRRPRRGQRAVSAPVEVRSWRSWRFICLHRASHWHLAAVPEPLASRPAPKHGS